MTQSMATVDRVRQLAELLVMALTNETPKGEKLPLDLSVAWATTLVTELEKSGFNQKQRMPLFLALNRALAERSGPRWVERGLELYRAIMTERRDEEAVRRACDEVVKVWAQDWNDLLRPVVAGADGGLDDSRVERFAQAQRALADGITAMVNATRLRYGGAAAVAGQEVRERS